MSGQFVDSSAWIALYDRADRRHNEAQQHWNRLQVQRIALYTSDYVFDETVTYLRRRAGHGAAVRFGTALLSSQAVTVVAVTADLRGEAWSLFQRYDDKVLSFTDCTSFALMTRLDLIEVFTFDDDFTQVGFVRRP